MKRIHLIFFDAGGGHRSATEALHQAIEQQNRPWLIEKHNLQDVLDRLDIFRKVLGIRMQDLYNATLRRGWTLGAPQLTRAMHGIIRLYHSRQVGILQEFWSNHPADLVVSLIPNFNRSIFEGLQRARPGTPFMTVLTDFADFPPHFWIERQEQYLVCGTAQAILQAKSMNHKDEFIFRASGMILHPRFYDPITEDRRNARLTLGLDPDTTTGLLLFGAHGSSEMEEIIRNIAARGPRVQLIAICGYNESLAARLRSLNVPVKLYVEGFTRDIPRIMHMVDFFIGKPGPASVSEAVLMGLPVIVERNSWTLPQERYNAAWVEEQGVGVVLSNFRDIGPAVEQLLRPEVYAHFVERARAHKNRAVFEIPGFMEHVLEIHGGNG